MLGRATQGLSPLVLPEALWAGPSWLGEGSAQALNGGGVCSERRSFQAGQREEEQEAEAS